MRALPLGLLLALLAAAGAAQPDEPDGNRVNRALDLLRAGNIAAGAQLLQQVAAEEPDNTQALFNLGLLHQQSGRSQEALAMFDRALQADPTLREAHLKIAMVHRDRGELSAVESHLRQAIRLQPQTPNAYIYLGDTLNNLKRFGDAAEAYEQALALQESAEAHVNLADALTNRKRYGEALEHFRAAAALEPEHVSALAGTWYVQTLTNDWRGVADVERRLVAAADRQLRAGRPSDLSPYRALFLRQAPEELRARVSASWAAALREQQMGQGLEGQARHLRRYKKARVGVPENRPLRVGYLSRRFEDYPGTELMLRVFGLHRRDRVEVFAYANGPDDGSAERATVRRDADTFRDISGLPPHAGALRIAEDGIDVLVDYDGHHDFNSLALLARRPAPVQLTWLGFPGPSSARAAGIDFVVADPVVVPAEAAQRFGDKVLWLPGAYQPQDHQQEIAAADPGPRPGPGFVYACFNRLDKADPVVFEVWMQLLQRNPGSVLWLFKSSEQSEANLRAEAAARGVRPSRLVFAPRLDKPEHLARHRLADVFLDTLAYNAHTTASDAMWAGLPVLTLPGETFSARVGASLVSAAGMPELIATSLRDYADVGARLPALGAEPRRALRRRRPDHTLFHTEWFTCGLEHGYRALWTMRVEAKPMRRLVRVAGPMPGVCDRHLVAEGGRVSSFLSSA